jgi:hypothetical protein
MWKYLVSYNDASVKYVKDESETGIANFLSEIGDKFYCYVKLMPVHSS